MKKVLSVSIFILFGFLSDNNISLNEEDYDKLSDTEKRSVEHALDGIDLKDPELEVSLFASEPMLSNPTNMDIDDKGRVWICEAYNYRNALNPQNPYKEKGDRILILTDTNGDGKADKQQVFYQGKDIDAALGIAVLGNKVYVSCSPNLIVFTDENGDDIPDKKEIVLTTLGGNQHDHGVHAVVFGPDGNLYFNHGNEGDGIIMKNGKPVTDDLGRIVKNGLAPYQEGMIYKSNLEFNKIEVLAWNFRNNYELALDSYGRMWQSDNDDDGNRSTRINFVMPYGNYGYKDEMTKADWRVKRTNLEDSVYQRHWHLNDPGVVPNLLQTYAGSPAGILMYEGNYLSSKYRNQLIHCDPGPNIVRAYPTTKKEGGFEASIINVLDGSKKDKWFRPSDITTAPDGSIFVADWYDPGVGGHAMGDSLRGRIYRISKKNSKYVVPSYNYDNENSLLEALKSPNQAIRFKAFQKTQSIGVKAESMLKLLLNDENPIFTARAYWLLAKINTLYIEHASESNNEDIRVLSIKMANEHFKNTHDFLDKMAEDASPQVRREVALALYHKKYPDIWIKLAEKFNPDDRWSLEAMGIAAADDWNSHINLLITSKNNEWQNNEKVKALIWRSRSNNTSKYLGEIINNASFTLKPRYYRAFDFQKDVSKNTILLGLLKNSKDNLEKEMIFSHLDESFVKNNPMALNELNKLIGNIKNEVTYLDLVSKYKLKSQFNRVHNITLKSSDKSLVEQAANTSIDLFGLKGIETEASSKSNLRNALLKYGTSDKPIFNSYLEAYVLNTKNDKELRKIALSQLQGWNGEEHIWKLLKNDKLSDEFIEIALPILKTTWHSEIRTAVNKKYVLTNSKMISYADLKNSKKDISLGSKVFEMYCIVCHKTNNKGVDFGPNLSQIGSKLTGETIYNAIINPSEGISFGYEGTILNLKNGSSIQGIITSQTEDEYIVKYSGSNVLNFIKKKEVQTIEKMNTSLMPNYNLEKNDLANLIGYLESLK